MSCPCFPNPQPPKQYPDSCVCLPLPSLVSANPKRYPDTSSTMLPTEDSPLLNFSAPDRPISHDPHPRRRSLSRGRTPPRSRLWRRARPPRPPGAKAAASSTPPKSAPASRPSAAIAASPATPACAITASTASTSSPPSAAADPTHAPSRENPLPFPPRRSPVINNAYEAKRLCPRLRRSRRRCHPA